MNVGAFLGIFALMFVLELPDKTFVATVIMSTKRATLVDRRSVASSALDRPDGHRGRRGLAPHAVPRAL